MLDDDTLNDKLTKIAKENIVGLKTLETQNCDDDDFHEVAVWSLKRALKEAYDLGYKEGKSDHR